MAQQMIEKMDELVARFHSLQGNNFREVKRSFNELLQAVRRDLTREEDLDCLIVSINPKTNLESVLKIDILIHFERYDALLDVLKSGNSMLIGKVLKCWKFFEVIFSKIDEQTLINQIFPHTSFSARMKIITKLSVILRDEGLADDYFHAIDSKYGLFAAKGLLSACSLDLIKSTVASYKIILSSRQLLKIVKKDREFLSYYFSVLHQAYGEDFDLSKRYSKVLRYVARIDDQLFWVLFKKYQLFVRFRRRMTPKLYENGKEFLAFSFYKQGIFNFKEIYKIIKNNQNDLHKFILEFYPKKVDAFHIEYACYYLRTFIGCLPKSKKYDIVNGCFKEAYGKDILEYLNQGFGEDLLQLLPVQEREIFVHKKVVQDESFVYMYPTNKSIPLLRERIKYTSDVPKRSELARLLYRTCQFNEDSKGLLEVLKYLRLRHKNDKCILIEFLISFYGWNMKKLDREHWAIIHELLKLVMSDSRMNFYRSYLMRKYISYAVKNKLSCDEFLRTFLKYLKEESEHFCWLFENAESEKFYYEIFARLLPQTYQDEDFIRFSCSLLMAMVRFNERCPKNKIIISRYSELMSAVKIQLTTQNFSDAVAIIKYCLKFEYDDIYNRLYWENFLRTCDVDMLIWYLQKKPDKLLEHIDVALVPLSSYQFDIKLSKLFRLMSLSMFNGISQKVISFSLRGIHHEDPKVAKFSATALSYLTTEDEYYKITEKFLPPIDGKIDINTMTQSYVSAQEALVKGLSNFNDPVSWLPLLLKFCNGDYTKYALGTLHRVAYRIPESKLKDFLDSLHQSVSVRKYAADLTTRLETKERVYNFLKGSGDGDIHASLQKIIFKSTLSYFFANPSLKIWNLFKDNIKIINEDDQEAFACLVNIGKIPLEYQPEYVQFVYEMLANSNNKEISAKKYDLLTAVHNNLIKKLDVQFLKYVVKDTLLQPNVPQGNDFYLRSIFYTTGEKQVDILNEILSVLKTYVEKNWTDYARGEPRKNVYDFIRKFCLKAIKINSNNVPVETLLQFWTSKIKNGTLLEEYLLLQLTNAYLVCPSEDKYREYGVKVSGTLAEWIGLHGQSIISMFAEELVNFLKEFFVTFSDDGKTKGFINGLLRANRDDFDNILVLYVIFGLDSSNSIKNQFDSALEEMRRTESAVVQIYIRRFLNNLEQ